MIVTTPEDRFSLDLGDVELVFGPLTKRQKLDVVKLGLVEDGETTNRLDMTIRSMQYCLKDVKGLKKRDGSDFKLEFEKDMVSEKSVDILLNTTLSNVAVEAALQFIIGVPEVIKNTATGDKVEHIEVKYLGEAEKNVKKKNT